MRYFLQVERQEKQSLTHIAFIGSTKATVKCYIVITNDSWPLIIKCGLACVASSRNLIRRECSSFILLTGQYEFHINRVHGMIKLLFMFPGLSEIFSPKKTFHYFLGSEFTCIAVADLTAVCLQSDVYFSF